MVKKILPLVVRGIFEIVEEGLTGFEPLRLVQALVLLLLLRRCRGGNVPQPFEDREQRRTLTRRYIPLHTPGCIPGKLICLLVIPVNFI